MIYEIFTMNGYGVYVWSAFIFTLSSFTALYAIIRLELSKEEKRFQDKFKNLNANKINIAIKQKTYKEILANTSISKI